MKKYWHIALMLFCVLMITSCGDDDEALEVDEVWKVQNEGRLLMEPFLMINRLRQVPLPSLLFLRW